MLFERLKIAHSENTENNELIEDEDKEPDEEEEEDEVEEVLNSLIKSEMQIKIMKSEKKENTKD